MIPPMARQVSGGVRQAIGDLLLSASYTGVRGAHTFTWIRANRNANGTYCAAFASTTTRKYSNEVVSTNDARNWYDALYLSAQKPYSDDSHRGMPLS